MKLRAAVVGTTGWQPAFDLPEVKREAMLATVRKEVNGTVLAMARAGKPHVEPFRRKQLNATVSLFSDQHAAASKTLLIGYTGNAARLMMPVSALLQHLDAGRTDLALLTDGKRDGYRQGILGLGDTVEQMIAALPGFLDAGAYRRIAVIGTSGGGLPAILTGLTLHAQHVVSVGGNSPDDPRWDGVASSPIRHRLATLATELRDTRVALAFGAQSSRDEEAARAMAEIVPANLVPIADPNREVGHAALFALVRQGRLSAFLAEHLALEQRHPEYIEVDHGKQSATYVRVPALADVPYPVQMEPNLVVEFYSR